MQLQGGNVARVELLQPAGVIQQLVPYTFEDGISSPIPLTSSPLSVRFHQAAAGPWVIEVNAKPRRSLAEVLREASQSPQAAAIFGAAGRSAPYDKFYAYWRDHPELPYRLGALLLAWLYRAEAVRTGGD